PHKAALIPLLDEIAPAALTANSVNTVIVRDGKLYGDSTDGYGLETALFEAFKLNIKGAKIVMLGAGGAAQATAFEFVERQAAELVIVNRTKSKAEALAEHLSGKATVLTALGNDETGKIAEAVTQADVVIQATSAGLKSSDAPPVELELLKNARAVFDMIYHTTQVQEFARNNNIPCADGRGMLLHQGAKSFSLWTGKPAAVAAMRAALNLALEKK
ncbi:MAG: saccharopine dehydrogenase NADP-binding domain-containing protein, partial [Lentisphaeria bacterium]|nr:saccharopine dehydrogenase NADP-binding domain-containing protein [Lentisphaeria bacterium]